MKDFNKLFDEAFDKAWSKYEKKIQEKQRFNEMTPSEKLEWLKKKTKEVEEYFEKSWAVKELEKKEREKREKEEFEAWYRDYVRRMGNTF
ncbi:hypothetical protein PTHTG4_00120 [Parageobacillus thermoglucosidasius]|jgi:hypothetical protein|uniref:hypothetical protein n=1 Tax=Parageobacillus thermoglucosidasius TaxID=1426 RepID=UPI000F6189FC|nr:hypothetical protein [Parageobacillus thermoglucosidasius]GCD80950.1 hypothetical protein PTHTG4_00120 [Parageobacillus thermoglucosidasius]